MTSIRRVAVSLLAAGVLATPLVAADAAHAQSIDCGEYLGLVCEGLFTDEPDVTQDPGALAEAIERVSATHGNPLAIVVASDTRGQDPVDFAVNLANDWGVGDPVDEDGIFVLIAIAERRTEVVTQQNIDVPGTAIANSGRSFFAAGDFDGGISAIIGSIDVVLSGGSVAADEGPPSSASWGALALVGLVIVGVGVGVVVMTRRTRRRAKQTARRRRIDAELRALDPRGDEIEMIQRFAVEPGSVGDVGTRDALDVLARCDTGRAGNLDAARVSAVGDQGAVVIVDRERMIRDTRVPLDLRSTGERPILEDGLTGAVAHASTIPLRDDAAFEVAIDGLRQVVQSLRPHRVAAARRRAADALAAALVDTLAGPVVLTHFGTLVLRAAPILDPDAPFAESAEDVRAAHRVASEKVGRVEGIRSHITEKDTRDVAATALADAMDDTATAVAAFEDVLGALRTHGAPLEEDRVSLPAVAALLVINNSASDIPRFVDAYRTLRRSFEPEVALEGALAGLFTPKELLAVKRIADEQGIPISIALALTRRRDDGVEVYEHLLARVATVAERGDARIIAGILAISLEPAVALERWTEARDALTALGLSGAYVDVAAAFGASDPRGPRAFALAYAAQRAALEDAGLTDLTRYAPELAHAGTSDRRDTWTGRPLAGIPTEFDPFTFFYLHWAASRGHAGTSGWDGLYTSPSWQDGGSTWWGGGGHFGSSGGSSWGSTWSGGGGGFSGGGFGGFGGGGGFSGGGGGGGGW